MRPAPAASLTIWLAAGDEDASWLGPTKAFHEQLDDEGVVHQWHVLSGDHTGDQYWRPHGGEYLRFYARALSDPTTARVS